MATARTSPPEWDRLVEELREGHPEVVRGAMFGMPCAKTGGKAFMGFYDGGAVFKLGDAARDRALALDGSALFDPMGGRPMKEWVVVPPSHREVWPELAEAALAKVLAR
jgi:hypothetical protein